MAVQSGAQRKRRRQKNRTHAGRPTPNAGAEQGGGEAQSATEANRGSQRERGLGAPARVAKHKQHKSLGGNSPSRWFSWGEACYG